MSLIILGVSGSVASYRAADIARELMRAGHRVRVCLTDGAQEFVRPALFEALTGEPCLSSVWDEPTRGRMAHIDWARDADLLLIAPATANTLNRVAQGVGDDMLTTLALAFDGPALVAPAMNPSMFTHPTVLESMRVLASRGIVVVEPAQGEVACGEEGQGKLASVQEIVAATLDHLAYSTKLAGKHVLITSGPTREAIDDVRFISNHSSGKMGAAMARAALMMGASVTVVSGPVEVSYPARCIVIRVESALEMLDAALAAAPEADVIVGVAAVADYRPASKTKGKLRRKSESLHLELVPNPDIIAALANAAQPHATVIGFAAEPHPDLAEARNKLERKGLSFIVHNDVSAEGIGFGSDANAVTLISAHDPPMQSGTRSKLAVAQWILSHVS